MFQINEQYEKKWWVKECHGEWHLFTQVADALGHQYVYSDEGKKVLSYLCDKYNVNESNREKLFDLYEKGSRDGCTDMGCLN